MQGTVEKLYKQTKEGLERNDPMYWQPHIVKDYITGKDKINDKYWDYHTRRASRYGGKPINPYNKINKHSQFLEKSENEVTDEFLTKKNLENKYDKEIFDTQLKMKYCSEYYTGRNAVVCKRCSMKNYRYNMHCWYCATSLLINKQK